MAEYQYSVSFKGRFLFRTEWENDYSRAKQQHDAITSKFRASEGYKVTQNTRDRTITARDVSW